ncbi:hypothetical protein OG455_28860 [Kitasatospora sp. NBC_01287]|uniref:hypothetical protein n=1 Tax=Kitasatospora sp. NBC_01287 TaxID=2903573 RepID=UPI002255C65D|nr:hypothetical protein [Kitasatospora sp. NBC_01287]MCX4749475.1 hypothetical protein [Kitasatospora sp. NBC_01287]
MSTAGAPGAVNALDALGTVLDASVEQIARAAADGHVLDRSAIVRACDIWDNNTYPLLAAATGRTAREREAAARRALLWLADFGPERRAWVERVAPVAGLLPAATPATAVSTPEELAESYDLDRARLSGLLVEREGPERISVELRVSAPRRFAAPEGAPAARLWLSYPDVDRLDFRVEAADCPVPKLSCPGATGFAADRYAPLPTVDRPPGPSGAIRGAAADRAARLLHTAMLQIRSVRHSRRSDLPTARTLAHALSGAGRDLVAAGERRWGRERAFRALTADWVLRAGPVVGPWWERTATGKVPWRSPGTAAPPLLDPATAQLRLVSCAAGRLTAQLAAPDGTVHVVEHDDVPWLTVSAEKPSVAVAGAVRLGTLR